MFFKIMLHLYFCFANKLPNSNALFGRYYKRIRMLIAKQFIWSCGKNVNIEPDCYFNCELQIGDNSGVGQYSQLHGNVTIGKNVLMGPYCLIYTCNHSFKRTDIPIIEQGFDKKRPVIIGDDVWIGARVTILPGVHIGNGCIIAAGSIVVKDIPPYSIAVGNPATIKKNRLTTI